MYDMTPVELGCWFEAYTENKADEMKFSVSQAYYTALFQRVKKMPDLDSILKKITPVTKTKKTKVVKEQTPEQLYEMIKIINKALGGSGG